MIDTFFVHFQNSSVVHEASRLLRRTLCGIDLHLAQTTLDYVVTCGRCREAKRDMERLERMT